MPSSPGGEGGIRTHGTVARAAVFKTVALDHSATSPSSLGHYASLVPISIRTSDCSVSAPLRSHGGLRIHLRDFSLHSKSIFILSYPALAVQKDLVGAGGLEPSTLSV